MGSQAMQDIIGGHLLGRQGFKPQTVSDATAVVGAIIDRAAIGNPLSMLVQAAVAFTTASGAAGGKQTLLLELYDDTAAGMGTEALYDSDTYVYTWAANGANSGAHFLPVDLKNANRYVRAKLTITKAGTVTISAQTGSLVYLFGGMQSVPSSSFAQAGYEQTTEPS